MLLLLSTISQRGSASYTSCQWRLWTKAYSHSFAKPNLLQKVKPIRHYQCLRKPPIKNSNSSPPSLLMRLGAGGLVVTVGAYWNKVTSKFVVHCETRPKATLKAGRSRRAEHDPRFDWKRLWQFIIPHIWYLMAAIFSALMVALVNIRIPMMLGDIFNIVSQSATSGKSTTEFLKSIFDPAKKLLSYYAAQAAFTFFYIYTLSCMGERIASSLRQELFFSIVHQDIAFFDMHKTGEIVNRLTADVQDFKSAFKLCIAQGLRSFTQTVGCLTSLYQVSPQMTGVLVVIMPTVIVFGTFLGSMLRKLSKRAQEQVAKATGVADEALGNVRTVRAFAMEEMECVMYGKEVSKSRILNEKLGFGIGLFQAASNLFLNGLVLGTLYLGGSLLTSNQLSPGDLMSFLVATQTIQRSMAQLSLLFGHFIKGLSAGTRVFEYMNLHPTIPYRGGRKIPFHSLVGDIEFKNVNFAYPGRPEQLVLKDFNLNIPRGKVVALVGLSGGGKSTVTALLERFYDIQQGKIIISGVDIKNLDMEWLRGRAIGLINQEPVLFRTSIMENIRYGKPEATDQEVVKAAQLANAHEFIVNFPQGYQTIVGERGTTVSGGQKQRIAIARALLKNPSILILDEATSALDSESEKVVQDALDKNIKGRTVLVIAHRLSTIKNAHIIAVLSKGVIAEMGTHEDLKSKRGLYWNLVRQQEREEEIQAQSPRVAGV